MAYIIINNYLPTSKYKVKATHAMSPQYITIHNTANDATAKNEIAYMLRNNNATSYHVAIDDKHVIQAIPFNRNAWHCGDGQGNGNRKSIGIEICYSKSGGQRYYDAEDNAVEYVAHILKQYNWGIEKVKWHRDWSGKKCPHRMIDEGRLDLFKSRVKKRLDELNSSNQVASTHKPSTPKKEEDEEMKFSSPSLKEETELTLSSKARRDLIVDFAVKNGAHESWLEKHKNNKMTEHDYLALSAMTVVNLTK